MHIPDEDFIKAFNNTFCSNIELEETELNDDDKKNLYTIKHKKNKENNYVLFIVNNIPDNNLSFDTEKLQANYIGPEDNNKLSQKQPKVQSNKNNENLFLSKKKTRSKSDQGRFAITKYEGVKKKRKKHDKNTMDNKITKIKSFIFRILILFFNQFLGKPFYRLHQIRGKQANNRTVNFNKELMTKKIKEILSDTGDDYNEKLLNDLAKKEKVKPYLEKKFEDIFNYLRNEINKEKVKTNNIFKIIKMPKKEKILDLYIIYQIELSLRKKDDRKIIEDCIKKDFVELINKRESVNTKRIKKIFKKKNK